MRPLTAAALAAALALAPALPAAPRLECREPSWDFGRINEGAAAEHVFSFTNAGADTLQIDTVRADCGCTGTVLSQKTVAPGKSGSLKVTFHSRNYSREVKKSVRILSNDPAGEVRLEVKAWVVREVQVIPSTLYFRPGGDGGYPVLDVVVVNVGEKPVKILSVAGRDQAISVKTGKLPISLKPADTLSLQASYDALSAPAGAAWTTEIVIKTSSSVNGEIKLPVTVLPAQNRTGF